MPARTTGRTGFNILVKAGHYLIGYVIMPDHLHAMVAFHNTAKTINSIIGNGKRFLSYDLTRELKQKRELVVLNQLNAWVNATDKRRNKLHEIFEPSFNWKECRTEKFIVQKLQYLPVRQAGMHNNPRMQDYVCNRRART